MALGLDLGDDENRLNPTWVAAVGALLDEVVRKIVGWLPGSRSVEEAMAPFEAVSTS